MSTVEERLACLEQVFRQQMYANCLSGYPRPKYYSRPPGVMGGPCLHCGASQPEHVGLTCDQVEENHRQAMREAFAKVRPAFTEPKCPSCGRDARQHFLGLYVCDHCDGRSV